MNAPINLQGLSLTSPYPGNYLEIDFAVGQPVGIGTQRPILLMGNMSPAGTAVPDTTVYGPTSNVPCITEGDVITLFGNGSELHRMYRRVARIRPGVSVYYIAVTASGGTAASMTMTWAAGVTGYTSLVGGTGYANSFAVTATGGGGTGFAATATASGGVIASLVVTNPGVNYTSLPTLVFTAGGGSGGSATAVMTATPPTLSGNWRVWVDDEFVDTGFAAGQAVSAIVAAAVTNIASRAYWAVTPSSTTGLVANDTLTLICKIKGPRGNLHRGMQLVSFGAGGTVNTTVTNATDAAFTSGATADTNATALTTVASARYYYIASAAEDATQFGAVASALTSLALPTSGNRQRCFAGSSDTLSNAITVATGVNNPRAEIMWLKTSPIVPSEMAAIQAATYAAGENGGVPRCNWNGYGNNSEVWDLIPSRVAADQPSVTTSSSCLNNGLTPIGVNASGSTFLVKRVTSKSLTGSTNDYRVRDAHKVTVCDFFGDDLLAKLGAQFSGKNLADDPPANQKPVASAPGTTTPNRIRDAVFGLADDYGDPPKGSGLLVNLAATKAQAIFQREKPVNPNRVSILLPLYVVDILDTTATLMQQAG